MCPIALTPGNNHPDESPDDERLGSWVSAANGLSAHDRGHAGGNAISGPVRVTENPAIDPWMPLAGRCR